MSLLSVGADSPSDVEAELGQLRAEIDRFDLWILALLRARGEVVIVSHAASHALAGNDDVLRVLVTASHDTRARRVAEAAELDDKKAAKLVADSDAQRAAYLKRFYGVGDELPTHYDMALNSDSLSIESMSALVVAAAGAA